MDDSDIYRSIVLKAFPKKKPYYRGASISGFEEDERGGKYSIKAGWYYPDSKEFEKEYYNES